MAKAKLDRNWPRWIKASCADSFRTLIGPSLSLFVEGTDRRTNDKQSYCEFRIDGPYIDELNTNFWTLDVEINLLIVTIRDDSDIYGHERNVGIVTEAFTTGIPLFKYGTGSGDDQSQWGCLQIKGGNGERIVVSNFGQVQDDTRIMQSTVEAHYRLNLNF